MRRSLVSLALAAALSAGLGASAFGEVTSWDEQNRILMYFVMDLASINAINGIHLTLDQTAKLHALARQVKAVSPEDPDLKAPLRPDLSDVRDAYAEARLLLLAGADIPESLHAQVAKARGIEAAVVTRSLARPGVGQGCVRCHGEPDLQDMRGTGETKAILAKGPGPRSPQRETFFAHQDSLVGKEGITKLALLASQVDAILTAEQKDVLGRFTCCLLPPKDPADPVRAGQAASGEKEVAILRWVRGVPAARWAGVKTASIEQWKTASVARSPELTEAEKARTGRRVAQVYDNARSLSDADFESSKDKLAGELQEIARPAGKLEDRERKFSQSMFLIGAGTVEAYDQLIRRLNRRGQKP